MVSWTGSYLALTTSYTHPYSALVNALSVLILYLSP